MTDGRSVSPPSQWSVESEGSDSLTFRNRERGLEVTVRGVFRGSKIRSRGATPTHYAVQLQQDWFAEGVLGERKMAAKVDTWEVALTTAEKFMNEFTTELENLPQDKIESTHRATDDHEVAEQLLTSEVAVEALADGAGYSDELLLDVLSAETGEQYEFVVHREGETTEIVAGDSPSLFEDTRLNSIYATFPVDKLGIEEILVEETPITMVIHLGRHTIYRFIFDDTMETDIGLPRGTQVTSPSFERTIANVLEEKW